MTAGMRHESRGKAGNGRETDNRLIHGFKCLHSFTNTGFNENKNTFAKHWESVLKLRLFP